MKQYENVFRAKNTLYAREFDSETKVSNITPITYIPSLWIPTNEPTEFISLYKSKPLKKLSFNSKKEYSESKKLYESSNIDVYGHSNDILSWIRENYPVPTDSIHDFRTWYIDIEVTETETQKSKSPTAWKPEECDLPITLIQIYDSFNKEFYILGLKDWIQKDKFTSSYGKVNYWKMSSEENLLKAFIKLINTRKPTVLIGFNSRAYDYPYITNRIAKVLDGLDTIVDGKNNPEIIKGSFTRQLSPVDNIEFDWQEDRLSPSRSYMTFIWSGIFLEDFRELYQKYTFNNLPSYSLESVATFELGDGKVSHDSFISFSSLYLGDHRDYTLSSDKENYTELDKLKLRIDSGEDYIQEFKEESYNLFVTYGIKDIELLIDLENKLKLYSLAQFISYTTGCTTDDVRGTLKQWHNYLFNEAYKTNKLLPLKSPFKDESSVQFVGGWTHASRNYSEWVSSLDYTSLYPSIMMWCNMGLESLVEYKDLPKEVLDIKQKYFINYSNEIDKSEFPEIEAEFIENVLRNSSVRDEIHNTLEKYNLCATPNGVFFNKQQRTLLSVMIENLMVDRKKAKKDMKRVENEIELLKKQTLNDEIKNKIYLLGLERDAFEARQMSLKVLLNSLYGSLSLDANTFAGSPEYFSLSVTSTGRIANRLIAEEQSIEVDRLVGEKTINKLYNIVQADTDSIVGGSLIEVDEKEIKIEDFFDKASGELEERRENDFIKHIDYEYLTPSVNVNLEKLEQKRIKYIMKHKVKKRLFKIKVQGKEVILTEDHSCMVRRNGRIIEVSPKDIVLGDELILKD